jgi:hypothetical protein
MKELVNDEYINNLFEILEDGSFKELFIEKLKKLEFSKWKEQLQIKRENNLKWIEDNKILEQIAEIEKELTSILNQREEVAIKFRLEDSKPYLKNKKLLEDLEKQTEELYESSSLLELDIKTIFSEVENNCGFTLSDIMDKDYSFQFLVIDRESEDWFEYKTDFSAEWDRLKCQILKCSAISEIDGLISTYITDKYTLLNERI